MKKKIIKCWRKLSKILTNKFNIYKNLIFKLNILNKRNTKNIGIIKKT